VNGQKIEILQEPRRSDYADNAFWFAPDDRRFGLVIEHPVDQETDSVEIIFSPNGPVPEYTAGQYIRWQERQPTPPIPNIERVSGKGATGYNYHNNGLTDFLRFSRIAREHGIEIASPDVSVLDWGCGCARLTRHFIDAAGDRTKIKGIDIDGDNIGWCNGNILDGAFTHVGLYPPTPFPDSSFDLIMANSVLSHLTLDVMNQWLGEVRRLLKPKGIAMLSYHGDFSIAAVNGRAPELANKILEDGFNADKQAAELREFIPDSTYYRQTFMTDEFAAGIFRQHFDLRAVKVGIVSRYQNVAILS
jgi:SAM-dependent methyltransferase